MGCCISSTFNHHQYRLNPFNNFHFEFILKLSKLCFGFEVDKSNYFEDLWDKKNLKIFSSRNSSRKFKFLPFSDWFTIFASFRTLQGAISSGWIFFRHHRITWWIFHVDFHKFGSRKRKMMKSCRSYKENWWNWAHIMTWTCNIFTITPHETSPVQFISLAMMTWMRKTVIKVECVKKWNFHEYCNSFSLMCERLKKFHEVLRNFCSIEWQKQ